MGNEVIHDTEYGKDLSIQELRAEYENLKNTGETEAETFEDYLENITDPNGTCAWCGERFSESELREDADLGKLCHRCIAGITSRGEKLALEY